MNCLCCGKPLRNLENENELQTGWHAKCVKQFFGTVSLPEIEITDEQLEALAEETVGKGITVPGVQKKLSLHLSRGVNPRLTLVDYPTGYILKPQAEEYKALPEAEYLIMQMAEATGIRTVPYALVRTADSANFAYITRRIDRFRAAGRLYPAKRAMEDFCQLDGRLTKDKYRGSYERCSKIITRYSSREYLDQTELFLRIVFSFVTGNSDMHLKNFSLIETEEKSGEYVLSEAYDMLPVNIVLPEDDEQLALTLNGKKRNLHRNDFLKFAASCGITDSAAKKMILQITDMKEKYLTLCRESYLPDDMKSSLAQLVEARIADLLPQ